MLTYEQASDKVIIALDCSRERAFELADMLAGKATWVKVGMTLFYAEGPAIVEAMRERGLRVFLDLKVHDIPWAPPPWSPPPARVPRRPPRSAAASAAASSPSRS